MGHLRTEKQSSSPAENYYEHQPSGFPQSEQQSSIDQAVEYRGCHKNITVKMEAVSTLTQM